MPQKNFLKTLKDRFPFDTGKPLQQLAMKWNYIVGQRSRWSDRESSRLKLAEDATDDLKSIGIRESDLIKIASAEVVEVEIDYQREELDWASRIFPWEYVLTSTTRKYRGRESLLVVRHLKRSGTRLRKSPPKTLTFIESAPLPFRENFDFEAEVNLVQAALRSLEMEHVRDPTTDSLENRLNEESTDLIHLTGIDSRLGKRLLGEETATSIDGMFFAHSKSIREIVNAHELAKLLTTNIRKPKFIGFNCWDSGARIAPLSVAEGAGAALGFQHTFDDSVAELFFTNFYRSCVENEWNLLTGFVDAWQSIRPYRDRIRGSSIVLWSSKSLLEEDELAATPDALRNLRARYEEKRESIRTRTRAADPAHDRIRDLVEVKVVPRTKINYASLHNGRSLLDEMLFRFLHVPETEEVVNGSNSELLPVGVVHDLEVKILLNYGADSFPYRTYLSIGDEDKIYDLADVRIVNPPRESNPKGGIRIALTSDLARTVDESMQTSLFVKVSWHGQILHEHTYPIWLQPVDQWKLDDKEIKWLPSFVQPRDPAVSRIIDAAQQHLRCLADYAGAGFDGYQSADEESILNQVRAIWSAIAFDRKTGYINPPPSYTESTQRLRTPSQVEAEGRGTCIDLTILLASCLEWIEIYPVIFMLDDHAFPGYWKDEESYYEFMTLQEDFVPGAKDTNLDQDESEGSNEEVASWIIPKSAYREIRSYIMEEKLIPLESVFLTNTSGYQDAVEEGKSYFEHVRHRTFHSMIDIIASREHVTPLPIIHKE